VPLTTAARDLISAMLLGEATTDFTNANSSIGAGNGAGAFSNAHTDLQGGSKFRQPVDASYPTRAGNVLTFRATFPTGQANFDWNEWGVFNTQAQSGGTMMNRKPETLGAKTTAQAWQFTATLTVQAA
jgi:hypothetical protein